MTTSGTISATVFTTRQVIESAARRCKVNPQALTVEYVQVANDQLYLLLSALANDGAPLWCVENLILPLYEGVGTVPTGVGTVDILNCNLRSLQEVTGTNTDTSTERVIDFTDDTMVTTIGIKWDAAAVPLAFARSDDNVTWTTIQTETAADATAGEWTWYDLDSAVAARYFRVQATSGTLAFDTIYTGNNPSEIPLGRLSRDQYTSLANRAFQNNQPMQYWLDRQMPQPLIRLNPVPNAAAEVKQLTVWRHRYIEDVGTMSQTLEIPQRWYEAVVSGLAAKLVWELDEADVSRAPALEQKADQTLYRAQMEERDRSPIQWTPDLSAYTR